MTQARHTGESIPPQNEVSGGPQTPLEIGGTGWKNTAAQAGHQGAQASAREVESGQSNARS